MFVAGGGWKSNLPGPRIKVKAIGFSVGAATAVYAGFEYHDKYGPFALAPGGVLFVTAVLLFSQFSTTGSRALLVIASGYFFTSLTAIPFALSFPGAFAPTGLLGAGHQSAPWLALSIRFGFAMATVGYAFLTSGKHAKVSIEPSPRPAILWSVAIIIVVVGTLIWAVILVFLQKLVISFGRLPYFGNAPTSDSGHCGSLAGRPPRRRWRTRSRLAPTG